MLISLLSPAKLLGACVLLTTAELLPVWLLRINLLLGKALIVARPLSTTIAAEHGIGFQWRSATAARIYYLRTAVPAILLTRMVL